MLRMEKVATRFVRRKPKTLRNAQFKERKFKFTGSDLEQYPDGPISVLQEKYVHSILAIEVGKHHREQPQ